MMQDTPVETSQETAASRWAAFARVLRSAVPLKVWLPVLVGALVLAALAAYSDLSSGPAHLNLVVRHNLQSAELSVLMDGKLSFADKLLGSRVKRFGIVGKRADTTFSKSLAVSSGEHVVQVRLRSAADRFDQTRLERFHLPREKAATLLVSVEQDGMSLAFHVPPSAQAEGGGSGFVESLRSTLLTVLGFIVSAGIGFEVQEFLRSKRRRSPSLPLKALLNEQTGDGGASRG